MSKPSLVVIVAPSGTGKSTLIERLMKELTYLSWSVSHTTRKVREGEQEGEAYHFVDRDEFMAEKDKGHFIEWAQVHENYYGTHKKTLEKAQKSQKVLLLDLDVQGADQVKKLFGQEACTIFIAPPSYEELERRLVGRKSESLASLKVRLKNAKEELKRQNDYDYRLVNDDLESCYQELKLLVEKTLQV